MYGQPQFTRLTIRPLLTDVNKPKGKQEREAYTDEKEFREMLYHYLAIPSVV